MGEEVLGIGVEGSSGRVLFQMDTTEGQACFSGAPVGEETGLRGKGLCSRSHLVNGRVRPNPNHLLSWSGV